MINLKLAKAFLGGSDLVNFHNVEVDGFSQWSAFTDGDQIADSNISPAWGNVGGDHLVSFFESLVLLDVVKVISSDGARPLHLQLGDDSG